MTQTLFLLQNPIKNYTWGSADAVSDLFGYPNPEQKPIAEVWMGAHSQGSSNVILDKDSKVSLDTFINANPAEILGTRVFNQFHALPFLFKILSAQTPLSVQVHPDLEQARKGFALENEQHIDLNDPIRNYKDPNHKPELTYAITPFYAMNGFREFEDIIQNFKRLNCAALNPLLCGFEQQKNSYGLETFFGAILTLTADQKTQALQALAQQKTQFDDLTQWAIDKIASAYPEDSGLLAPLFLNVICLQPGEAVFLTSRTPHAYLFGTALEIMANSDNVLRAGLTPKNIDVKELLKNTTFQPLTAAHLQTAPVKTAHQLAFLVPVDDFKFAILTPKNAPQKIEVHGPEVLLALEDDVQLEDEFKNTLNLKKGESAFISAQTRYYVYTSKGKTARAYC